MPKDLVSIKDISKEETEAIIDTALSFKDVLRRDIKKVPAFRGKTVVNLFFEPSTRTKTSFELAEKRLSLDVINFAVSSSSVVKGESLLDTVRTIESIRNRLPGYPSCLFRSTPFHCQADARLSGKCRRRYQ